MTFNLFRHASRHVQELAAAAGIASNTLHPRFGSLNWHSGFRILTVLCLGFLFGCSALGPHLPPVNLDEPAWALSEGQAVWRTARTAPELAGELLVATNRDGRAFVQFSKNPFPLLVAQSGPRGWEIRIPTQNKRHAGPGKPPLRLIWLYIPKLLAGAPPPAHWHWQSAPDGTFHLENDRTGESIEGFLSR